MPTNERHPDDSLSTPLRVTLTPWTRSPISSPSEPSSYPRLSKAARELWRTTDVKPVKSYSFSLDRLRVHLLDGTLEIVAKDHGVEWSVHPDLPPLAEPMTAPFFIVCEHRSLTPESFDPHVILDGMIGRTVRYAPTPKQLYLFWTRDLEIAFNSYKIIDGDGWFLHYCRCDYRK